MPAVPVPLPIRPRRTLPGAATCGHLGRAGEIRAVSLWQGLGSGKDCGCLSSTCHTSSQVTFRSGRRGGSDVRTDRGCARSRRESRVVGMISGGIGAPGSLFCPALVPVGKTEPPELLFRSVRSADPDGVVRARSGRVCRSGSREGTDRNLRERVARGPRRLPSRSTPDLSRSAGPKSARPGRVQFAQTSVRIDARIVRSGSRFSLPISQRRSRRWLATPTGGRAASRRCRWVRGGRRGRGRIRVRRRCWPRPAGTRPVSRRCARRR